MRVEGEHEPAGRTPEQGAVEPHEPEEAFGHPFDAHANREDDDDLDEDLAEPDAAEPGSTALPPKLEAWRRRSAAGAILTGFALGLQQALETRKDEPSIVLETSGDPPKDLPVEAEFEYGRPRHSVVQIRPWLLPDQEADAGQASAAGAPAEVDTARQEGDPQPPDHPRGS